MWLLSESWEENRTRFCFDSYLNEILAVYAENIMFFFMHNWYRSDAGMVKADDETI